MGTSPDDPGRQFPAPEAKVVLLLNFDCRKISRRGRLQSLRLEQGCWKPDVKDCTPAFFTYLRTHPTAATVPDFYWLRDGWPVLN